MTAGPEQARLMKEFEREFIPEVVNQQKHHEEGFSSQNLVQSINEMGNPFFDGTPELLMLDTRNVIDECVVKTVRTIEALGKEQYKNYNESVVKDRTRSIHETIKKNSLPLFRCPTPKAKNKQACREDINAET